MQVPLYESEVVRISYLLAKDAILVRWKREARGASYRMALEEVLRGARRMGTRRCLDAGLDRAATDPADLEWRECEWDPRARALDLTFERASGEPGEVPI